MLGHAGWQVNAKGLLGEVQAEEERLEAGGTYSSSGIGFWTAKKFLGACFEIMQEAFLR